MATDIMELWGGFPSREMLKSRERVKGGDCDPLSPSAHGGSLLGVSGPRAGRVGRRNKPRGVPLVTPVPEEASTEQGSPDLGPWGAW